MLKILENYKIFGEIIREIDSPAVRQIYFKPQPGSRFATIKNRELDLARELDAEGLLIRQKGQYIIFEIPQKKREVIPIDSLQLTSDLNLPLCLGVDSQNQPYFVDLAKLPHLLVAGTTGAGKSVALNCFLYTLIKNLTPENLKLLIIDPKQVEFILYNNSKYLWRPIVTELDKAAEILDELIDEMNARYCLLAENKVKNIVDLRRAGVELPYIVCVIDEFADLVQTQGKIIEENIQNLAQKARAAGIHIILATQRPSVDVITGTIKANFPNRLAFRVASAFDSKTILNESGAEKLLGCGDSFLSKEGGRIERIQSAYISDSKLAEFLAPLKSEFIEEMPPKSSPEDKNRDYRLLIFLIILFLVLFLFFS